MAQIVSIHQPCFMPWIGFFSKMMSSDVFVILDHVQFVKDEYDNRVKIKTSKGSEWITVPVYKKHRSIQLFKDTEIDNSTKWNLRIIRVLSTAYSKAPFFGNYWPIISDIFNKNWKWLLDLNLDIITTLSKIISIQTPVIQSCKLPISNEKASDLNLKIVKLLNGNVYLSGTQGKFYLNENDFLKEKVSIIYQDNNYPTYDQQGDGFVPGLSILDILFNAGADQITRILEKCRETLRENYKECQI